MTLLVLVGLAFAAKPAPVVDAVEAKPNFIDEAGFEHLPAPIWKAERIRWCGLIETATHPQAAGKTVDTALEVGRKDGASFLIWHFYDEAANLTLNPDASQCLSQVNVSLGTGNYRFSFSLPTDSVSHDDAVDGAAASMPAFAQCEVDHPKVRKSDVVVATVVDTDGTVWTSDGTRETDNLRSCLAQAQTAWVKEQIAQGTFALASPAVVFGKVKQTPVSPEK